jgi:hypothetical protein
MIVRRYGNTVLNVTPNFDARAMNEVGFLRDGSWSLPTSEFEASYERGEEHALTAQAEGDVQDEVEETMLEDLRRQLDAVEAGLAEGEVLRIESEQGRDYPKTRGNQTTLVVGVENRLRFTYEIEPPLRVAVWRPKS